MECNGAIRSVYRFFTLPVIFGTYSTPGAVKPAFLYKVMVISIADDDYLTKQIKNKDLPVDWRSMAAYPILQKIGSDWYKKQKSVVLKIPSAIIPLEYNYIINTEHPHFQSKVKLVRTEDYFWDSRLL